MCIVQVGQLLVGKNKKDKSADNDMIAASSSVQRAQSPLSAIGSALKTEHAHIYNLRTI